MLLNRKLRGRSLYRLLLILPWAMPAFVSVFTWRFMLADGGVINGCWTARTGLAGCGSTTPLAAVRRDHGQHLVGVPFMMVALLGGLQSITRELYEAAEMDGATPGSGSATSPCPACAPSAAPSSCSAPSGPSTCSRDLPADRQHRRRTRDPGDLRLPPRLRTAAAHYAESAAWGILILSPARLRLLLPPRADRNEQQVAI